MKSYNLAQLNVYIFFKYFMLLHYLSLLMVNGGEGCLHFKIIVQLKIYVLKK
jgi:hypothetical protein